MDSEQWGRWWELAGKRAVARILLSAWDPIGLGERLPADEYACVADELAPALEENAPQSRITAILAAQARDHFGLHENVERDERAAGLLVEWYAWAFDPSASGYGWARDSMRTDLMAGYPVVSPDADRMAIRAAGLMSDSERDRLYTLLERRAWASPAASTWAARPPGYLSELDPERSTRIERQLAALNRRLTRRAAERGWELPA